MTNIKLWDKQQGFTLPDGTECTRDEVYEKYPQTRKNTVILEYLPNGFVGAIDDAEILKQVHSLPPETTPEELISHIIYTREHPPAPLPSETQLLGRQITDLELLILEGGAV